MIFHMDFYKFACLLVNSTPIDKIYLYVINQIKYS